jgi:MoxR-like ATPase
MSQQARILELRKAMATVIVGQTKLLDRMIIGLLAGGHILVEGLPGLAKTTAIKTLAGGINARFKRVQFTPDLLPGDLTGTDIYDPREGHFHFVEGPLFNEIILADEINRSPAKVQSALLEAMQESQITVGGTTRPLPPLFMVMATQNPLEQAGTYPLPEAQLDRFLLHVMLTYPNQEEELEILRRDRTMHLSSSHISLPHPLDVDSVLAARREVGEIHLAPSVEGYIIDLVRATRNPGEHVANLAGTVEVGASPRASLALSHASAALAYLRGRDYVTPDDIREMAPDCLRHRIILSLEARLAKLTRDELIKGILDVVEAP